MNCKLVLITAMVLISLITVAFCAFLAGTAKADTTRYVKVGGVGDGTSWVNASDDLQSMVDAVELAGGGTVCVASGTYTPTIENGGVGPRYQSFQMRNTVGIYGGFPNTGNPAWQDRDWETYKTVLSGEIGNPGTVTDNCYHVFYHPDEMDLDGSAVLDGFIIRGGNADGPYPHFRGGGMFNLDCSPSITNCLFHNNSASHEGGGVSNTIDANPTFSNCHFSNNSAVYDGGGMYLHQSSPTLQGSTFTGNDSVNRGGGISMNYLCFPTLTDCVFDDNSSDTGGGIEIFFECSPTLSDCLFSENSAFYKGGGVMNSLDSHPTLSRCTFSANQVIHDVASGGGMHIRDNSSPVLSDCVFTNNLASGADADGAAVYCVGGSPTFTDCVFTGNTAGNTAGGIFNLQNWAAMTNCILAGNTAHRGGAFFNTNDSRLRITNCTISSNEAVYGGGIYSWSGSHTIVNSIIWGNISTESSDNVFNKYAQTTITYSNVQGSYSGTGNIDKNPLFVDSGAGDYRLSPLSPCINSGSNSAIQSTGIVEDFEGEPRIQDGIVDIGADEEAEWTCMDYDANLNMKIDFPDMVDALMDYLTSKLSYPQMVAVLMCYLTG